MYKKGVAVKKGMEVKSKDSKLSPVHGGQSNINLQKRGVSNDPLVCRRSTAKKLFEGRKRIHC